MASPRRIKRLESVIVRETAKIFQRELNDPRIGPVVVTQAQLSKDLRFCKILVNPRGTDAQRRTTLKGLQSAIAVVQGLLGDRLELRFIPQFAIEMDKGVQKAIELERLFEKIKSK